MNQCAQTQHVWMHGGSLQPGHFFFGFVENFTLLKGWLVVRGTFICLVLVSFCMCVTSMVCSVKGTWLCENIEVTTSAENSMVQMGLSGDFLMFKAFQPRLVLAPRD